MWFEILKFEIKYRATRPATYIYFLIMFLLSFLAISTDAVRIGGGAGLVKENAPATIATMMVIVSAFFMMITSAIMGVSVLRDHDHQTESMIFTTPITKFDYLMGRFLGSFIIVLFVFLGMMFGFIFGEFMPWRDADKLLPFNFWNYFQPFLLFVVPNLFFSGAIFFASGALSKKIMLVYTQGILLFIFYQIGLILTQEVENREISAIFDPFAFTTVNVATQYWSVSEQNSMLIPFQGAVMLNRIIWVAFGAILMILTYFSFSFNVVKKSWFRKKSKKETEESDLTMQIPSTSKYFGFISNLKLVWGQSFFYLKQVFKGVPLKAMVVSGMAILIINSFFMGRVFGINTYPTTYQVIELVQGFNLFFVIILVFYSGELIWKERDAKINLIYDASPVPDFVNLVSKFLGMIWVYVILLFMLIITGVLIQTFKGYYDFNIGIYFSSLYTDTLFGLVLLTLLAFFVQVMVNNKFLGHAFMIVFFISFAVLPNLGVEHRMFRFGSADLGTYSDMNGYGHFIPGFSWFNIYWFGLSSLLFGLSVIFSVRGSEAIMKTRAKIGKLRLTKPMVSFIIVSTLVFVFSGGFIFYNTNVINSYQNSDTTEEGQANYEKTLKQYEFLNQPVITDVRVNVDIYPYQRDYVAEVSYTIENQGNEPINEIHIQYNPDPQVTIDYLKFDIESTVKENYEEFFYVIYDLNKPLQPGEKTEMQFKTAFNTKGFVEGNSTTNVVFNGSFFNNFSFPTIGYNENGELNADDTRKEYELKPKVRLLKQDNPRGLAFGILGDDARGVNFEIIMSTSNDQIAIAPGYLIKEWVEDNRKYFHYKMDVPIENFYNMISARYEVTRDVVEIETETGKKEINLEIYYHKGHEYNLDRMMRSMKKSLVYFSENFSPFQYSQMRILEFPRYATFAQSFANTVPFSEGIGFVLEIKEEKDVDIAYYVTAHEVGHQWWAHQVMAANVQGSQMIIETLAQYSALMMMKNEYPEEHMQEFLKEEMNRYLSGRALEQKREMPIQFVENQQYIHYGKGAVNMFALQDYVSEDSVNMALKRFIKDWSDFKNNRRYATATDLIGYLKDVTPDSLKYLVADLFEKIILFENKVESAEYTKVDEDEYNVELKVSSKKFEADSVGRTTLVDLTEWIDIGVYGEDDKGKDKLLYIKKHRITQEQTTINIKVKEQPKKAGIDPINKLIDRNPEDNVKSLTLKSDSA